MSGDHSEISMEHEPSSSSSSSHQNALDVTLSIPAAGMGLAATSSSSTTSSSYATQHLRAAAAALWSDDEQLQHFLHLLTASSDSISSSSSSSSSSMDDTVAQSDTPHPPQTTTTPKQPLFPTHDEKYQSRRLPTVPTALSRRMLHKQGAGYLDTAVAFIASAAADRFLATVLHQAIVCRDRRIQGEDIIVQNRKQFLQLQKMKKRQHEEKRKKIQKMDQFLDLFCMKVPEDGSISSSKGPGTTTAASTTTTTVVETLQQKGIMKEVPPITSTNPTSPAATSKTSTKKRNNAAISSTSINTESSSTPGHVKFNIQDMSMDQISKSLDEAEALLNEFENDEDSVEEEESYYHRFYEIDETNMESNVHRLKKHYKKAMDTKTENQHDKIDNDEEEVEDKGMDSSRLTLQLKDLVRPLEAWGINLLGKLGMDLLSFSVLFPPVDEDTRRAEYEDDDAFGDQQGELQSYDVAASPSEEKTGDSQIKVKKKRSPTAKKVQNKPTATPASSTQDKEISTTITPVA